VTRFKEILKKHINIVIAAAIILPIVLIAVFHDRREKYPGALKLGSAEIPKTLMPYSSMASVNTFAAGLLYDTILGGVQEPDGYDGVNEYLFEDGAAFQPADEKENYFKFSDGLCETAGAYERKEGSDYGFITFTPTEEQYAAQLARKKIVKGKDEIGNPIAETDGQFAVRSEQAVPKDRWRTYRFKVRDGYMWSDGKPFTARDIEFTFKYILKYSGAIAGMAFFLSNYYSCEAESDTDFALTLASNKLSDIKTICNAIMIIPAHIWSGIAKPAQERNLNPVGTGAYTVKSSDYIEDSSVVFTFREDYDESLKREKFAYEPVKKIVLVKYADQDVMLGALQAGEIDASFDAVDESKVYAIADNPRYNKVKIASYESEYVTTLAFNVGKNGAFRDGNFNGNGKKIRMAIAYAIDQNRLIENVRYNNASRVGGGLVPEWMPHALRDGNGNYVHHSADAEKANALLDEAGYRADAAGKRNLSFSILASAGSELLAREIGAMVFETVGIEIGFTRADSQYSEVIKQSNGADFDMIINGVTFETDKLLMFDARFGVYPNGSPRVFNYTGVISAELSALMLLMDTETNIAAQYERARDVQRMLIDLCLEIPLFGAKAYSAYTEIGFSGWVRLQRGGVLNAYTYRYLQRK
jgi:peptide/nickel transport system substrate-binding protein